MITTKPTIDFGSSENMIAVLSAFDMLQQHCHAASYNRGWWHDPITGLSLLPGDPGVDGKVYGPDQPLVEAWFPYVVAAKIALIHSETSELLEAHRVGAWDDKIPFPGMTAEGADIMIRVFDLFGMLQWAAENSVIEHSEVGLGQHRNPYSLGAALLTKLTYNVDRPDHDITVRAAGGGKKY